MPGGALLPGGAVLNPPLPDRAVLPGASVLDALPGCPRAMVLLIAISVYREHADRNAVLFSVGSHDWTAARSPDRQGPAPPYQGPADLTELLSACLTAGLLSAAAAEPAGNAAPAAWFVDRWVAAELHGQLESHGHGTELAEAHGRAAYWQWRSAAWPQDRRADLHDLLEARYHLFCSGDEAEAGNVTRAVCAQLHAWGDLGREAELIQSTLDLLPCVSASRASWLAELGAIAAVRRDHPAAVRWYTESAAMCSALADHDGVRQSRAQSGRACSGSGRVPQSGAALPPVRGCRETRWPGRGGSRAAATAGSTRRTAGSIRPADASLPPTAGGTRPADASRPPASSTDPPELRSRVGAELSRNHRLRVPAGAARQLRSGRVDTRLLAALATLADLHPLRVIGFGDSGPGASAFVPLRSALIETGLPTADVVWAHAVLRSLAAQQPPYRPSRTAIVQLAGGQLAVRFEYPAPGPLGLLTGAATRAR